MKVINKAYSDTNVIMIPITLLITAVDLLCFRTFIPLVIRAIPPIKNINSTSKNGHFISIIVRINSILYLLIFIKNNLPKKVQSTQDEISTY